MLFKRIGNAKCQAAATDGRILVSVDFDETRDMVIPGIGADEKKVKDFSTIIGGDQCRMLAAVASPSKLRAKKTPETALVKIDEASANGVVSVSASNIDVQATTVVSAIEGRFPKTSDVIPHYEIIDKPDSGIRAVSIPLNGEYLRKLAEAVTKCAAADNNKVTLIVPVASDQPILLSSESEGVKVVGALMPLSE